MNTERVYLKDPNMRIANLQNTLKIFLIKQHRKRFYNSSFEGLTIRQNFLFKILRPLIAKAEYKNSTMFLTISLMDSFLAKNKIDQHLIPTVGIIALTLASKFNELFYIGIDGSFFKDMKECLYIEHFALIEKIMLSTVDFNVNLITPYSFIEIFLHLGYFNIHFNIKSNKSLIIIKDLLFELLFLISSKYEVNKYQSASIALSLIMIVRKIMGKEELWTYDLTLLTGLIPSDINQAYSFCDQIFKDKTNLSQKFFNIINRLNKNLLETDEGLEKRNNQFTFSNYS